jgi:Polyketide cyclase / dehydrase and lipid transport
MRTPIIALAIAAAFIPLAGGAQAASIASGKKLEVHADPDKIDAEKNDLWAKFGGWCQIAEWHPAIKSCVESKEGDASFRTLTLQDGGIIKEKLLETNGTSYRYAIIESPLPVKNYEAAFSVTPDDDDLDEVNVVWAATYDPADGKEAAEARKTIDGIFKDGIESIKTKLGDKAIDRKKKKKDDD